MIKSVLKKIPVLLILFCFISANAQEETEYIDLIKAENHLEEMFDALYNFDIETDRSALFNKIDSVFKAALTLPGSFDYQWQKLDKIARLKSDDDQVKVFSWLYMVNRNEYKYTAFIQVADKKESSAVFRFIPGEADNIKSEDYPQKLDDWHGKVYYDIVTTKEKRRTYYTLLGYDLNNIHSTIKTIEVMALRFGKPVFLDQHILDEGKGKDRLILEYSADVTASLNYNDELKMIVFDHLAPLHPLYHGNYQFYGPDGSYDGLKFVEGIWVREEDVDARND